MEAEQPFLVTRLDHLVDQLGGGGEADGEALLAVLGRKRRVDAARHPRRYGHRFRRLDPLL